MSAESSMISQTQLWLERLVIGLNLCPFAHREFAQQRIRFTVDNSADDNAVYDRFCTEIGYLMAHPDTSTTLIIWPTVATFESFLNRVGLAEQILNTHGWATEFQLAHFHPNYCFADSEEQDPANYTNRSPWPLLHILRSEQMEKVLARYPKPEQIPLNNIELMRKLGNAELAAQLKACRS
ncbi:DUF1415 domain-containing protein [Aliidiomarina celeris]|uniref:DUF1415 domain-containing protein n=1 Tax=Aliidiomarina celeris TaxID=2249428 RepID=UPI000DE9049F|nr:DUF1415 domain-containing protein [Aliidiomarina celeris]